MISCIPMLLSQLFVRSYGTAGIDCSWSIVQTPDGGYGIAGYTTGFGAGGYDGMALKLNPWGGPAWVRTVGGPSIDDIMCVTPSVEGDGGLVFAGSTQSYGVDGSDVFIFKMTSAGNLSWVRTFDLPTMDDELARYIVPSSDGGYVVAAYARPVGAGQYYDFLVLKLSSDGNLLWARTFVQAGTDELAVSITGTTDGGCAVVGYSGSGPTYVLALRFDASGNLSWARRYWIAGADMPRSIIQTSDGGFAIAGYTSYGAGVSDCFVLKLDPSGGISWARTYGGPNTEDAMSIIQTSDGGYAIVGMTRSWGVGNNDVLLIKLNSAGAVSWARTFGGMGFEYGNSIVQTSDGGYAIAGYTDSYSAGSYDYLILRLDQNGYNPDYPGCIRDCSPTEMTPTFNASSPTGAQTVFPSSSNPSPSVMTPTLNITNICAPVYIAEVASDPRPRITCSPVSGGTLFVSPVAIPLRIYSADAKLVYSGNLEKGENRINLDRGVYLWQAGAHKGKAVVR